MGQKRVSFKVAKAIKEAGYPQDILGYTEEGYKVNPFIPSSEKTAYSAPYYLEVWLWLWKVKKIAIDAKEYNGVWSSVFVCTYSYLSAPKTNPEEAIIAAIDYLVDNNLIK